jgi:4-diphosphocytidyl-2-C-methyl-D-erythritol kinase
VKTITVRTAAKLNLSLRVLGRRADGYHSVETVLHTIGLWDRLRFSLLPEPEIALSVDVADVPGDESNLCWRAARLLADHTRSQRGVAIALEKGVPVSAGLGGGSSDAAATLAGLARLWELDLSLEDIAGLGAQLGADVPFFLRGGCCLALGKGEKLQPLADISAWFVIVVPDRRVVTAQAYVALHRGATRGRRRVLSRPTQRALQAVEEGSPGALARSLHNDFECLQMAGIEEARRAKADLLEAGCLGAGLSGSGSGVFGIAADREAADRAAQRLRSGWPWVRTAPTVRAGRSLIMEETTPEEPA